METRHPNRKTSVFLLFVIVGAGFFSMVAWSPTEFLKSFIAPPLDTGVPAPPFELETLDGKKVALADYKGRPVLLKFWNKG